jgi:hypothetical protein
MSKLTKLFTVTTEMLETLKIYFLSLDDVMYLYKIVVDPTIDYEVVPAVINKLTRYGFIKNDKPTPQAEQLLIELIDEEPEPVTPKYDEEAFNKLWLMFPKDDAYRHHSPTRPIRYNKQETRKAYQAALNDVTHEQLVSCLEKELFYRRSSESENLFKYMKGSLNWFKDKAYENYIDEDDNTFYKYDEKFGTELS